MARDTGTRMAYTQEVGRARYELYRGTKKRLKEALELGFWIEAIALCESILSDRLEARLSHLGGHEEGMRRHKTLGALVRKIRNSDPMVKFGKIIIIYDEVDIWNDKRNKAIHQAVKISDGEEIRSWNERYDELKDTAVGGADLVRRLSNELRRIKENDMRTNKI